MKILINNCFGGFGYSDEAWELYASVEDSDAHPHRHDKTMIAIHDSIGKERFSAEHSDIIQVEISDGLDYDIDDYDGKENIIPYLSVELNELANGLSPKKMRLAKLCGNIRVAAHYTYMLYSENIRVLDEEQEELKSVEEEHMELEEQINHSTGHNHDENGYDEFCSICNS